MIIEDVRRCDDGAELLIDGKWYFFKLTATLEEIKAKMEARAEVADANYSKLEALKGSEI